MLVAPAPLPDHDVDAEVLHREIEHLFRGARHAMHFVDEQHFTGRQTRQQRRKVARVLDGRSTRQAKRSAALVGDDHREGRLAEPGGSREQDVVGRTLLDPCRVEQQLQLSADLLLPDELGEGCRPEGALDREFGLVCRLGDVSDVIHPHAPCAPARAWRA